MSTTTKRKLLAELRKLRTDRNLTQERVATDMEWSLSKVIRIENGAVKIAVSDLRSLLAYYGILDPGTVQELLNLARAAKQRMWCDNYRDAVSPQLLTYAGYETEATRIGWWQPILFPGLMQTEQYAHATLAGQGTNPAAVERQVQFRLERQRQLFTRATPAQLLFVLDESVLYRHPGGDDKTLVEQLDYAVEFAQAANIAVHVLPYTAGAHPGWNGEYIVVDYPGGQVLAGESCVATSTLVDDPAEASRFNGYLSDLVARSYDRAGSIELMRAAADEVRG